MATYQDLQNLALWRLRQRGVNFGAAPGNGTTDQDPPYLIQLLLNMGYSEFLSRTLEAQIATLKVYFPTVANAINYPLNPLPPNTLVMPTVVNPAAMRVIEGTYTVIAGGINAGYEYKFPIISSARFAAFAGSYTRRLSWFGPYVYYAARLFRKPLLDVLPGTATTGDQIALTIVPDPYNSPLTVPATLGGPLQNPTDVPLFPQQFHMALVDYVVMNAGDAANKGAQVQAARESWENYVDAALMEGGTEDGGDPYRIGDVWAPVITRDGISDL